MTDINESLKNRIYDLIAKTSEAGNLAVEMIDASKREGKLSPVDFKMVLSSYELEARTFELISLYNEHFYDSIIGQLQPLLEKTLNTRRKQMLNFMML